MKNNILKYKKVDEIEHVLLRPGMYLGSTSNTTTSCFVLDQNKKMCWSDITYNPALIKMFDEIITNSVDEHKRTGNVSKIKVNINPLTEEITISDDGGITVQKHPEYDQYIPEMIFGELRTGSNFDDEGRTVGGLNGLGSKLASIFSKSFKVETSDGSKSFTQLFLNNLSERTTPTIKPSSSNGTKITFLPDYSRLGCRLDEQNYKKIEKRVYDVAGCNPNIKVYFNDELIKINKFKDYISLYVDEFVQDGNQYWDICVAASNEGFRQVSFVNGIDTFNGGTHVDYIINQIITKLREYIKKKHKINIKPANIKQSIFIFINCTINNPIFTSQTKENMSADITKDVSKSFVISDKFINKLISSELVQNILDWAESQQRKLELEDLRKLNRQSQSANSLKKIIKFDDATGKDRSKCILALTEGNSASFTILSARDPKTTGVFPLRGKLLNVRDIKIKKLTSNEEIANIMSILGLKIGHEHSIDDLRFSKILIAVDPDCIDGEAEVLTKRGDVKVKDVNFDDEILTHSGQYKSIEKIIQTRKERSVKLTANGEDRYFSEYHKLFIMRDGKVIEECAKCIKESDQLLIKK